MNSNGRFRRVELNKLDHRSVDRFAMVFRVIFAPAIWIGKYVKLKPR